MGQSLLAPNQPQRHRLTLDDEIRTQGQQERHHRPKRGRLLVRFSDVERDVEERGRVSLESLSRPV